MLRYDAEGGRATITIDDPDRMNPLANETTVELVAAVHRWRAHDPDVRVVVITGAGDRAFSAGGDLSGGFVDSPIIDHAERGALADLFRALRRCGKPTVARVNGHALGGGFGLAAACDITIAADTATLGTPEINVGLWPMMISAVLMPLVSRKALLEMMLTGRRIRADEADGPRDRQSGRTLWQGWIPQWMRLWTRSWHRALQLSPSARRPSTRSQTSTSTPRSTTSTTASPRSR